MCIPVCPWDRRWFRTLCFREVLFWTEWSADPTFQCTMVSDERHNHLLLALSWAMWGSEPWVQWDWASFSILLSQILAPSSPVTRTTNLISSQLPSDPDYQSVLTKQPTLGFNAVRHPSCLSTIGCWGPVCPVRPQEFSWACLQSLGSCLALCPPCSTKSLWFSFPHSSLLSLEDQPWPYVWILYPSLFSLTLFFSVPVPYFTLSLLSPPTSLPQYSFSLNLSHYSLLDVVMLYRVFS